MEDFLLSVLVLAVLWLFVRQSRLSRRLKALEAQQHRMPATEPLRTSAAAPPSHVVPPPAPTAALPLAPYSVPYIPPTPPVAKPAPAPPTPKPHVSLEARLGQNWLNKLGITALVIGLALGLGKIVTTLGPLGKDSIGFTLALGLLALGIYLERKPAYKLFARVLIGGGWALLFFLSFALYHVPLLTVLHSEAADLVLMFLVATGMVAHSLRYHSQVVTAFAFLLAFVTVGLSNVTLFSLVAGAILTLALVAIVYRERWYALGLAGLVAVYVNHFLWLHRFLPDGGLAYLHTHGHPFTDFLPSALLLVAYWLLFRLLYVFRPPLGGKQHNLEQTLATTAALLNSAGLLGLFKYQSSHPEWAFYGLLALGLVELAFSLIARGGFRSDTDAQPNRVAFITLSTLASVLLLAAIPFRFHGTNSLLFWLLEAEAFYLAGIRLPERIFRRLGLLASLLTAAIVILATFAEASVHPLHLALFLTTALVLWFNAEATTHFWPSRLTDAFDRLALQLNSYTAALLIALLCCYKLEPVSVAIAWGVFGLVLFELGLLFKKSYLRYQSYALLAAAFIRLFFANLNLPNHASFYTVLPLIAAFAWVYESHIARTHADTTRLDNIAAQTFAWCCVIAAGTLIYFEMRPSWVVLAWTLLAIALLTLACALKRSLFIAQALVVLLAVLLRGIFYHLFSPTPLAATLTTSRAFTISLTSALLLTSLPLAFYLRRYFSSLDDPNVSSRPERSAVERTASPISHSVLALLHHPEQPFFFVPLILLTLFLYVHFSGGRITIAWVALGLVAFLFALTVKERSYRLSGLALLLLAVAKILAWDVWHASPTDRYLTLIIMGAALLLVSFLYSRYRETLLNFL